jgi:hypothetical protein
MVDGVVTSATPVISYRDMHNLCNINVEIKRNLVTKAKSKFFIAERVIERRGGRGTVL